MVGIGPVELVTCLAACLEWIGRVAEDKAAAAAGIGVRIRDVLKCGVLNQLETVRLEYGNAISENVVTGSRDLWL